MAGYARFNNGQIGIEDPELGMSYPDPSSTYGNPNRSYAPLAPPTLKPIVRQPVRPNIFEPDTGRQLEAIDRQANRDIAKMRGGGSAVARFANDQPQKASEDDVQAAYGKEQKQHPPPTASFGPAPTGPDRASAADVQAAYGPPVTAGVPQPPTAAFGDSGVNDSNTRAMYAALMAANPTQAPGFQQPPLPPAPGGPPMPQTARVPYWLTGPQPSPYQPGQMSQLAGTGLEQATPQDLQALYGGGR